MGDTPKPTTFQPSTIKVPKPTFSVSMSPGGLGPSHGASQPTHTVFGNVTNANKSVTFGTYVSGQHRGLGYTPSPVSGGVHFTMRF